MKSKSELKRIQPQKEENNATEEKIKRFFSVSKCPKTHGEHWQGYQIEVLELKGQKIFNRYMFDKPDTKQIVMAKLELINDPDNQEYGENGEELLG